MLYTLIVCPDLVAYTGEHEYIWKIETLFLNTYIVGRSTFRIGQVRLILGSKSVCIKTDVNQIITHT